MPAPPLRLYPALLVLLVAAGCGSGAAPPTPDRVPDGLGGGAATAPAPPGLSTDRSAYAAGDSLTLRLVPTADVEYNLCHAVWTLERRRAGRWERHRGEVRFVRDADRRLGVGDSVCDDVALLGRSGETARYTVRLSDRLAPGAYRFRAGTRSWSSVGPGLTARGTLATAPFEIR